MNKQQMMAKQLPCVVAIVLLSMTLVVPESRATITEKKHSWDFGVYKYEMGNTPILEDLDLNGTNDFEEYRKDGTGSMTASNGLLTLSSTSVTYVYQLSNTAEGAWRALAPTRAVTPSRSGCA